MAAITGCEREGRAPNPIVAMREHADRMSVDLAIANAINEPDGGNYASAVALLRASNRSPANKKFETGQLVVGSFIRPGSRRPVETLQQGLDMMEQVVVEPGDWHDDGPQQLRMMFERGVGTPPNRIPIDRVVADCWHRLENGGAGDPAACVALRRRRLPQLSP